MRTLTVRQPWAWAIVHGGKNVENRTRNIAGDYRGPIAIHVATSFAAGATAWDSIAELNPGREREIPTMSNMWQTAGRIIGVVDLDDVHRVIKASGRAHCETVHAPTAPAISGACSSWAERDAWHLVLTNPRPLRSPITYRGGLGLRELPGYVAEQVMAAVA